MDKLDIFSKMAYFADCKKIAIIHLFEFRSPLNIKDCSLMNIFYNAYFTYWLGLVDYLIHISFLTKEDIVNLIGSEDSYYYIRNLRNSIIHRAEDLSTKGTIIKNIVVPFSPVDISDQSGKKLYQPFCKDLMQIIIKCEGINQICLNLIHKYDLTNYVDLTKDEFINRRNNDPYIPSMSKTIKNNEENWLFYLKIKDEMKKENVKRLLSYFETNSLFQNAFSEKEKTNDIHKSCK